MEGLLSIVQVRMLEKGRGVSPAVPWRPCGFFDDLGQLIGDGEVAAFFMYERTNPLYGE